MDDLKAVIEDAGFERPALFGVSEGGPMSTLYAATYYRKLDVRAILPAIDVPTLVLHRVGDRMAPVAQARYLAESIPGARLVELPGDDHLPFAGDLDALLE